MSRSAAAMLLITLPLAACVTLTPAGARVRLTSNPDVVRQCLFLGNVSAASTTWNLVGNPYGQPGGGDQANAEAALRDNAASIGADTVHITLITAWRMSGEAYSCEQHPEFRGAAATPAPSATPTRGDLIRDRIYTMMKQVAQEGQEYAWLNESMIRERFLRYIVKLNPKTDDITIPYLKKTWQPFLAAEGLGP